MHRKYFCLVLMALFSAVNCLHLAADAAGPSPVEGKLRDALRSTMMQLRDVQSQLVAAQTAQAESDKEKADLSAKVDALTAQLKTESDQAKADQATAEKTIADLKQSHVDTVTQMVDTLSTQINALSKPGPENKATLDKAITALKTQDPDLSKALDQYSTDIQLWTTGYDQYVQLATKTETERAKVAAQVIMLQRVVADRETKNLALYQTGNEILDRYAKFSLGDALEAKEPFIGITRVKLQEFVQDYKDKLADQKITIGQAPAVADQDSGPPAKASDTPAKTAKP